MNLSLRKIFQDLAEQSQNLSKYLILYFYIPASLVLFLALSLILYNPSVTPDILFRDITATTDVDFYYGFVSQLGLILWTVVATSCFFALFFLHKFNLSLPQVRRFILHSALLSVFLLFDDMFLLHEDIAPEFLNIGQAKFLAGYLILFMAFVFINRKAIIPSEYLPFVLVGGAFSLSIAVDVIADKFLANIEVGYWFQMYETFIEDGFKFIGITSWTAYYLRYIYSNLTPLFEQIAMEKKGTY